MPERGGAAAAAKPERVARLLIFVTLQRGRRPHVVGVRLVMTRAAARGCNRRVAHPVGFADPWALPWCGHSPRRAAGLGHLRTARQV